MTFNFTLYFTIYTLVWLLLAVILILVGWLSLAASVGGGFLLALARMKPKLTWGEKAFPYICWALALACLGAAAWSIVS